MNVVSMTGFGRAAGRLSDRIAAAVVIRTVNHRFLDVHVRTNLREEVPEVDTLVRSVAASRFQRGRVNAQVNLEWQRSPEMSFTVNAEALRELVHQLRGIQGPDGAPIGSVELGDLLSIPGLIAVSSSTTVLDEDEQRALERVISEAAEAAAAMRRREGEQIAGQIEHELAEVVSFLDWFEPQMDDLRARLVGRTRERVLELVDARSGIDEDRVAQEAALIADRADVAEEVVRLRAHLQTFSERLAAGGVVGRTLDFLCQEIHRELNTLGTKCRELGLAERVVDAKTGAERVREQVQNLE
jgi:uncharacterized protein (TIGR00255 family)